MSEMEIPSTAKLKSRDELVGIRSVWREQGRVLGFTSGAFDILHPGHVDYLERAKSEVDVLVVAVNSDSSIKQYKSPLRPINSETERVAVVAALTSVDFVYIFDEPNNSKNIEILKPDIYIKAGDYTKDQLSSADLVESYGGKVMIIPALAGHSTSRIVNKILETQIGGLASCVDLPAGASGPAVFLDRDGTLIEEVNYLHEPEKVKLIPGTLEALKQFRKAGFRLIIVTNQPGIGLGYYTKEDFFKVNARLLREVGSNGVFFDKIYFCPHTSGEGCECRKPKGGMLLRAERELRVDLKNSFIVGDMSSDIKLGADLGLKTVLVKTGKAGSDNLFPVRADFEAADLFNAVGFILKRENGR